MIGFTGTRVIVVDDKEDEALPVLKALARRGIPAAFFHAPSKHTLPRKENRLIGVRLAILDMDLIPGTPAVAAKASTIASYLGGILSANNGPYGVIAWTYHPEIVEQFERYIYLNDEIPNPIFTVLVQKNQCIRDKKCDLHELSRLIDNELAKNMTLHLFEEWEGSCFVAATSVTNTLAKLAKVQSANLAEWRQNWTEELLSVLNVISRAEAGEHFGQQTCVNAVYQSLNPLHADSMDNLTPQLCDRLANYGAKVVASAGVVNAESRAQINSMLHLSFRNIPDFSVGNVYVFRSKRNPSWASKSLQVLQGNWVQGKTDELISAHTNEVAKDSIPILLDITAVCDHAQRKTQRARLLSGIMVPSKHKNKLNTRVGFIKSFGPFRIEPITNDDLYYFYFSSRQVRSVEITDVKKRRPVFRLRNQLLDHLRFWVAQIETRPGIVLLGP